MEKIKLPEIKIIITNKNTHWMGSRTDYILQKTSEVEEMTIITL